MAARQSVRSRWSFSVKTTSIRTLALDTFRTEYIVEVQLTLDRLNESIYIHIKLLAIATGHVAQTCVFSSSHNYY